MRTPSPVSCTVRLCDLAMQNTASPSADRSDVEIFELGWHAHGGAAQRSKCRSALLGIVVCSPRPRMGEGRCRTDAPVQQLAIHPFPGLHSFVFWNCKIGEIGIPMHSPEHEFKDVSADAGSPFRRQCQLWSGTLRRTKSVSATSAATVLLSTSATPTVIIKHHHHHYHHLLHQQASIKIL